MWLLFYPPMPLNCQLHSHPCSSIFLGSPRPMIPLVWNLSDIFQHGFGSCGDLRLNILRLIEREREVKRDGGTGGRGCQADAVYWANNICSLLWPCACHKVTASSFSLMSNILDWASPAFSGIEYRRTFVIPMLGTFCRDFSEIAADMPDEEEAIFALETWETGMVGWCGWSWRILVAPGRCWSSQVLSKLLIADRFWWIHESSWSNRPRFFDEWRSQRQRSRSGDISWDMCFYKWLYIIFQSYEYLDIFWRCRPKVPSSWYTWPKPKLWAGVVPNCVVRPYGLFRSWPGFHSHGEWWGDQFEGTCPLSKTWDDCVPKHSSSADLSDDTAGLWLSGWF